MSTAQLNVNAWMQSENTLAAAQSWISLEEQEQPVSECAAADPPQLERAQETTPALPDDFWQDWFGIWE